MDNAQVNEPVSGERLRPAPGAGLVESLDLPSAHLSAARSASETTRCFHCGTLCRDGRWELAEKSFCCQGCRTVFEILSQNGLTDFYQLADTAGVRVSGPVGNGQFEYLDEPAVRERLVDYSDARLTRVTFHLPAMHCIACVWLLENLFRLKPGVGESRVNFPRKEVAISFDPGRVKLSEVAGLLTSLGYEPDLKLVDLEDRPAQISRRLWLQLGLAGFGFGNTMFFSIAGYFGLDAFSGPTFRSMVGYLSLLLALPVVAYSALDYWRSAWVSLRQRLLNIDVPIAAGIAALFIQSTHDVLTGAGEGYFDSLCGLLFFLLCGRLFQQKTYHRLAFDRDYKAFFPLSVCRVEKSSERRVSLSQLAVGDRLRLRNGELIPADSRLVDGPALIDYSFVTGEAEPVEKQTGDYLYAGGRQLGGAIEVETVKPVSQSYLTSLWNQEAFRKDEAGSLQNLTNQYSQRFTRLVLAIAVGSALFWAVVRPAIALKAFTSVLIVACPCALALAAPFALGAAQRLLARRDIFLKNAQTLETLARVDAVVFDKTGTLTAAGAGEVTFAGPALGPTEERWIYSMTRHSTHPYAVRIGELLAPRHFPEAVRSFVETAGCGMEGSVDGHEVWMGSASWLQSRNVVVPAFAAPGGSGSSEATLAGSVVHVAIDGRYAGAFHLSSALRPDTHRLAEGLADDCELALLSGDNDRERARFEGLFGPRAELRFNQSPLDKLVYIRRRQEAGKVVLMVGDGLNDAGALKQSDVGAAVVEITGAFSPASDVILSGARVARLDQVLRFSREIVRVIRASFLISALYNLVGIAIAAQGRLSPVVCAILMPLSSVTVVAFASGVAAWRARRILPSWSVPTERGEYHP